ncbi:MULTISPECIES: hypothetical protein [Sphingobacterium]|uniref:hypothetical protein n=1 Tax=Sphingobacterium TaxID=28453 RepID=UPI0013DACDC1|nr:MULTISPECIES: hypothetical protein [unclassified Sphingobacterium]
MIQSSFFCSTCLFVVLLLSGPVSKAQTSDSTAQKTTFTWTNLWSSNANYYGQTAGESLPFVYTDLTLRTPIGWYVSAGGYQLLKEGNFPSELHVGTGFEFALGSKGTLNVGYNRSFYSKDSPLLQASNPNSATVELGLTHLFQTDLGADYNFGQEDDFFVTLTNSKIVPLHSFTAKDILYIKPNISVTAGTQRFYTSYIEETQKHPGLGSILNGKNPTQQEVTYTETTVISTDFTLLSYNFQLPVIWQYGNGSFLASYQLSLLGKEVQSEARKNSFFNVGYFYQF